MQKVLGFKKVDLILSIVKFENKFNINDYSFWFFMFCLYHFINIKKNCILLLSNEQFDKIAHGKNKGLHTQKTTISFLI